MPLVSAKCTNCGASLEVDNTKDAAICPHCDTPFIVEKAVNYYNTTNNITAEVVNVYGGNSADFVIRAGELIKYNGAATDVVIPNSVTMIGKSAFAGCSSLSNITIPDSVASIGLTAFSRCNRDLKINASVEWKKNHWSYHPSLAAYKPQTQPQNQGGCYIATAVYGSYDCPSVWTLRRYRDDRLLI